ncbi:MAG TPA: class D sortase [Bryobacteraceae bacterium]|nr:class D sortase [Bryobacteraceae bacterium]
MTLRSRHRKARAAIVFECFLLLAGFILVGWFLFSLVEGRVAQSYDSYRLDASLRGERPTYQGYLRDLFQKGDRKAAVQPPQQKAKRPPMPTGALVGRIEIPRINISAVVREGSDDKTLKRAAGHIPSTALPGESGNVGIAAHRDGFFRNLRSVKKGDQIRMVTTWGTYEYEVSDLKIVQPEDVEVLEPGPKPLMTLVTCYPFNFVGNAPKRFIVHARQLDAPDIVPTSSETGVKKLTRRKS